MRRFKRNLRLRCQLFMALLRAARYSTWINIFEAFALWFRFAKTPNPTPYWVYFRRLRTCYRCQVFNPKTRCCGSLNPAEWPDGEDSWGCGCFCPASAHFSAKQCWLVEIGAIDAGWTDEFQQTTVGTE